MERLDDAEDKRLMAALASGDDRALETLIARWQRPVRNFVFRSVPHEHDADDLLQETFVRVYRHRERYRPEGRFSTWLFTIAINLCRNHAQKQRRRPTVSLDAASDDSSASRDGESATVLREQASNEPGPAEEAASVERAAAVRAAIESLPHDLRTAVILFEYEHLSHAEIADATGTTAKAIETRLYRARHRLREKLARWLVD